MKIIKFLFVFLLLVATAVAELASGEEYRKCNEERGCDNLPADDPEDAICGVELKRLYRNRCAFECVGDTEAEDRSICPE